MSDINRAYHARKTVKLGGRKLEGWTPQQVAELQAKGRERGMKQTVTALGRALIDKGIVAINVAFQIAITKFMNGGGQFGVAYAMLCAAYGRSTGPSIADINDGVHSENAGASTGRGAGRETAADKAIPSVPASRHSHAKRGADAIASVQPALAKSLFDSIVLPDGRRLREVRWSECPMLAQRYQRLTRILLACRNYAIPTDPATTLDAVVTEAELAKIVAAVEQLNHVE